MAAVKSLTEGGAPAFHGGAANTWQHAADGHLFWFLCDGEHHAEPGSRKPRPVVVLLSVVFGER